LILKRGDARRNREPKYSVDPIAAPVQAGLKINIMNTPGSHASCFTAGSTIRLVVVDDNKFFRDALRSFLVRQPDLEIVAEAENGLIGVEKVHEHRPDVVLMDISMPVLNGIDATRIITSKFPGIKVIIISVHDQEGGFPREAYEAGAFYFFSKTSGREELLAAIHEARPGY
jgi:DNA-binding NarL/FixJ family response regulator